MCVCVCVCICVNKNFSKGQFLRRRRDVMFTDPVSLSLVQGSK